VLFGDLACIATTWTASAVVHKIEPKKTLYDYGAAASPVVHDGLVVMLYDNQEGSYLAAYDAATGEPRCAPTRRKEHLGDAVRLAHQAPHRDRHLWQNKNRGYDLSGKLLWEFDGRMSNLVIPSPFAANGLLYIASGYVGDYAAPGDRRQTGGVGRHLAEARRGRERIHRLVPAAGRAV